MNKRDLVLLAIIAVIVFGVSLWSYHANKSLAGSTFNLNTLNLTAPGNVYLNQLTSTTTQSNLAYIGNASTSYSFGTKYADQVNFNMLGITATTTSLNNFTWNGAVVSSSNTAVDLNYCYYYSDDAVNWFQPASNCAYWNPGTTGTTTMNFAVSNVNSKFMKLEVSSSKATSTRFGLWSQAVLKQPY